MDGDRLKYLRLTKGLTQKEISKKLNISQNTYSQYERNLREPDNNTLIKIADFFITSTDYLLGRTK